MLAFMLTYLAHLNRLSTINSVTNAAQQPVTLLSQHS